MSENMQDNPFMPMFQNLQNGLNNTRQQMIAGGNQDPDFGDVFQKTLTNSMQGSVDRLKATGQEFDGSDVLKGMITHAMQPQQVQTPQVRIPEEYMRSFNNPLQGNITMPQQGLVGKFNEGQQQ